MNLNFLQSILMGFVSGLAEMMPVSAEAHRALLRTFFGVEGEDAVFRLLIHISCLTVLTLHYSDTVLELRRAGRLMRIPPKRRKRPLEISSANTVRLLRTAVTAMAVLRAGTLALQFVADRLSLLSIGLVITGILLFLPAVCRSGNMDSRNMPKVNGLLMGIGAGMSVLPGISPVAGAMSLGMRQGVDRGFALRFAHLLLMPVLLIQCGFDLISIFTGGAAAFSFSGLLYALAGAIAAGFGCRCGLELTDRLVRSVGFVPLAYYSWGMALLCFTLFLMI